LSEKEKPVLKQIFEASTVGIQLVLSTFVGLAIGLGLDKLSALPFSNSFFWLWDYSGLQELFRMQISRREK